MDEGSQLAANPGIFIQAIGAFIPLWGLMKNSNETVEYPHVDLLCNGQHYTWRKGETTRCCSLQVFLQFEDRLQKMFSTNWIEPVSGFKGIRKYNTVPPIELNHSLILKGYMSTD